MKQIKDENFVNIAGWMRNKLNLTGNELIAYAIIYGFSQNGESCYNGSLQYFADFLGTTKKTALTILQKLVEKGLIEKNDIYIRNIKCCEYRAKINKNDDFPEEENHIGKNDSNKKTLKLKQDPEEYKFVDDFINKDNPTIQYLTKRQDWILKQYQNVDLLNKDGYSNEAIQLALQYIKQDDFRSKNILTIEKLRRKNKDGVPYIVVILELIKNRKPKIIDLDK